MTLVFNDKDLKVEASETPSEFDEMLLKSWEAAMKAGHFRYDLEGIRTRVVPGRFGYVMQFNNKRFTERRRPHPLHDLDQAFDPLKFNFTKVAPHEILFRLARAGDVGEDGNPVSHPVLINVAPIGNGHVLIVPHCSDKLNQVMRKEALLSGLSMMLLSSSRHFCLGFNSLLAYASVNHLHLHGWYSTHDLVCASAAVSPLAPQLNVFIFREYPVPGFVFLLKDIEELHRFTHSVQCLLHILHSEGIPHNALFCRTAEGPVRACVWPRQEVLDNEKHVRPFNVAVAELGGLIICQEENLMLSASEERVQADLGAVALGPSEFQQLTERFLLESEAVNAL